VSSSTSTELTDGVATWFKDVSARQRPFDLFAALRSEEPLHWNEPMQMWVISRYEDAHQVLHSQPVARSGHYSKDISYVYGEDGEVSPAWRLSMGNQRWKEGADLDRQRRIVGGAFSPRSVKTWIDMMETIIEATVASVRDRGEMDFMRDFAFELPLDTMCAVLGIPTDMRKQLHDWTNDLFPALFPFADAEARARGDKAALEYRAYIEELVEHARAHPDGEGLLDVLVRATDDEGALSDDELAGVTFGMISAGHETTGSTMGSAVLGMLTYRDQWDALSADPELAVPAFEEALRWQGAAQMVLRWAMEDFELHGQTIKKTDTIALFLLSTGRDDRVYVEPDRFWSDRTDRRQHLGFGTGPHFCCGNQLARAQGRLLLTALTREFPTMKLATDDVEWSPSFIRTLATLPLTWN
jgi:cytochrome P450